MSSDIKRPFDEVLQMGGLVAENMVTVGASLGHVHVPGRDTANGHTVLGDDQVELGMGIHNEPGFKVLSPRPNTPVLVDMMLDQLTNMRDSDRAYVDFEDSQHNVVLVNNLGGVSPLEFGGITTQVVRSLGKIPAVNMTALQFLNNQYISNKLQEARSIKISRVISGTYMTSLDGPGLSITLLKATPEILRYIDMPTTAVGWTAPIFTNSTWENRTKPKHCSSTNGTVIKTEQIEESQSLRKISAFPNVRDVSNTRIVNIDLFRATISAGCQKLISAEPEITHSDTLVGDGDCGTTLARGATAVLSFLKTSNVKVDAVATMLHLVDVVENNMDGTSGALYSIFLTALASFLRSAKPGQLTSSSWAKAAAAALENLQKATPARQGDRTMMDALEPFIGSLVADGDFRKAVDLARKGVEATKGMKASLGRAVYVEDSAWGRVPDPGAQGVLYFLEGMESAL
jgi:dihydroxyacetone kinase